MIGGLAEVLGLYGHLTHFVILSPVLLIYTARCCCYFSYLIRLTDRKVLLYTPFNSSHVLLSSMLMILALISLLQHPLIITSHHITLHDMASHSHR
jgi:hypothetical protein